MFSHTSSRNSIAYAGRNLKGSLLGVVLLLCLGGPSLHGGVVPGIHEDSLTSYLAAPSLTQDISPSPLQGLDVSGEGEGDPCIPMTSYGPGGGEPVNTFSDHPGGINSALGTAKVNTTALALPAEVPWSIGHCYNFAQRINGTPHDSDGYQGVNWFQSSQPEIALFEHKEDDALDMVYLIACADWHLQFKRVDSSNSVFIGVNGTHGLIQFTAASGSEPELYTYHGTTGRTMTFFGFDSNATGAKGQIWKIENAAGDVAYVGHETTASTAISSGYNSGKIVYAFDSEGRRYHYEYDGSGRLESVTVQVDDSGWVATGDKVEYEYHDGTDAHGSAGDLKLATVTRPLSDSGVYDVRQTYYRYWKGTFGGSNPGEAHAIKYIVDSEGLRRFGSGFATATDGNLKPYASAYYEYDADRRVVLSWTDGSCGCGSAADGTYEFIYEANGGYTPTSGYSSEWFSRMVAKQPDGSYVTQYVDHVGQMLSRIVTDGDPDDLTPPNFWATIVVRNSAGQVTKLHTPANVTGYDHSDGTFTTSTTVGLVRVFERIDNASDPLHGLVEHRKWQEGTSGDQFLESTVGYTTASQAIGGTTLYRALINSRWVYTQQTTTEAPTGGAFETTYAYTAYSGAPLVLKQITTTHPPVSTANNGSGTSNVTRRYLRLDGTTAFTESADGIFTYTRLDGGRLVERIDDARTSETYPSGDQPNADFGITETGDGWHRETGFAYDPQGRPVQTDLPDGRVLRRHYSRLDDQRLATLAYADYEGGSTPKFYGPVQYTVTNHAGRTEVQGVIKITGNETTTPASSHVDVMSDDPLMAVEALGLVTRLTINHYNDTGRQLEETRAYHSTPTYSTGGETVIPPNYATGMDATTFAYDDMGRRIRVEEPHGTIRRTVFDAIGRVQSQWIGTDDTNFTGAAHANMVKVSEVEYDGGNPGGNSRVTKQTAFIEASATGARETVFTHDVRGRVLLVESPTAPHAFNKYDNLGRVIASAQYSSVSGINPATHDPTTLATNRLALSETSYDERGRVWRTTRHKVRRSNGASVDSLQSRTWYDAAGRTAKVHGEQLAKTSYDRLGRQTHRFILARTNDFGYLAALNVTGDIVVEEHQTVYESSDSDRVVMSASIARYHDDFGTGETTGPLDTNADDDPLKYTDTNIKGRIQISASWHDRFGRVTDTVAFGTYGGATFDRAAMSSPPARSDDALVTTYTYDVAGALAKVSDPKAIVTAYEYDDTGRQVKVIADDGGANQTVEYVYEHGLKKKMIAHMPSPGTNQETAYSYGTTRAASPGPGESLIATGHLLSKVTYPDSAGANDASFFSYNAQGQPIWTKDQAGNVIETDFDDAGRQAARKVTTLATGFDDAVKRIGMTYDELGRTELVTQYDAASGGSVVNEVEYAFDGWGNLTNFKQDRNSAVGAIGSVDHYEIAYTLAKNAPSNARHTLRRSSMTMPDGRSFTYDYSGGGSGNLNNDLSRVRTATMTLSGRAIYDYNGLAQVVGTWYPQPHVQNYLYGSTSGDYPGLDRFNRTVTSKWTRNYGSGTTAFYNVDITYDRNSNILRTIDHVHSGFDVNYDIDDLNRLIDAEEGTWSGSAITSKTRHQNWTLDHAGNWDNVKHDFDGSGWDVDEDRDHNDVNELLERDSGTPVTLVYDAVGNLIDDGSQYKYVYDAFGRLRKMLNQSDDLVAEYVYNGLGHRIGVHYDVNEDGDVDGDDPWFWFAYDERWRIVATFRDDDPPDEPKEIFVYHAAGLGGFGGSSYIDAVILRDRDANTDWDAASDGVLEERIYYCQNWRQDVVALITEAGVQVQQIRYSAYGIPIGLPAGDVNSNGSVASADDTIIAGWISGSTYDVRGDLNLDGVVDNADRTLLQANLGTVLGWGVMSLAVDHAGATGGGGNRKGYAGYEGDFSRDGFWHVRHRVLDSELGRWTRRDPLGYVDGASLYEYAQSNALPQVDPFGLLTLWQCQQAVKQCLFDTTVYNTLLAIAGCKKTPPTIQCVPCGVGGHYHPGWNMVFICFTGVPSGPQHSVPTGAVCQTMIHELVHAYDYLCGFPPYTIPEGVTARCAESVCTEIRAYHCDGTCAGNPNYWACLRSAVWGSSAGACGGDRYQFNKAYNAVFATCIGAGCPGGPIPGNPPPPPQPRYPQYGGLANVDSVNQHSNV